MAESVFWRSSPATTIRHLRAYVARREEEWQGAATLAAFETAAVVSAVLATVPRPKKGGGRRPPGFRQIFRSYAIALGLELERTKEEIEASLSPAEREVLAISRRRAQLAREGKWPETQSPSKASS